MQELTYAEKLKVVWSKSENIPIEQLSARDTGTTNEIGQPRYEFVHTYTRAIKNEYIEKLFNAL